MLCLREFSRFLKAINYKIQLAIYSVIKPGMPKIPTTSIVTKFIPTDIPNGASIKFVKKMLKPPTIPPIITLNNSLTGFEKNRRITKTMQQIIIHTII